MWYVEGLFAITRAISLSFERVYRYLTQWLNSSSLRTVISVGRRPSSGKERRDTQTQVLHKGLFRSGLRVSVFGALSHDSTVPRVRESLYPSGLAAHGHPSTGGTGTCFFLAFSGLDRCIRRPKRSHVEPAAVALQPLANYR